MFNRKLFLTIVLALAMSGLPSVSASRAELLRQPGKPGHLRDPGRDPREQPGGRRHTGNQQRKTFKSHPVLDGYPKGTTFVYRSPNLFGGRAAARLNTDILVFAEKSFASKDAALRTSRAWI